MNLPPENETVDPMGDYAVSDTSIGKKKRSNTEAAEYPRRRATIAVSASGRFDWSRFDFDLVSDMPATQDPMQWSSSQVSTLLRFECGMCLSRTWYQTRRWR